MTESIKRMFAPLNCGDLNLTPYAVIDGKEQIGLFLVFSISL